MTLDELRSQALADPDVPEGVRRALEAGAALEEIRLDARGRWWHQGEPFVHARLIALFHRSLARTPAGLWLLHIAPYSYPVVVDGAGRFAHRLHRDAAPWTLELLDGGSLAFRGETLWTDGEDGLYVEDEAGQTVRLIEQAYRVLTESLEEDASGFSVAGPAGRFPIREDPRRH
jgi:uncharacterized protein